MGPKKYSQSQHNPSVFDVPASQSETAYRYVNCLFLHCRLVSIPTICCFVHMERFNATIVLQYIKSDYDV